MKKSTKNNVTRAWLLYQEGLNYNNRLIPNQYNMVNANTEFFTGNQWINLPNTPAMRGLPRPVFNILKRVTSLFIASLTSSGTAIHFDPLAYYDGSNMADPDHDAAEVANATVNTLLEKFKFDYRVRDALFDGAVTGDYCAHFWFDPTAKPYGGAYGDYRGELKMELVDGINVMVANPNSRDIQSQDYVILVGRDTVAHLRAEQKKYRKNKDVMGKGVAATEMDVVQQDAEYEWQTGVGGKIETSPTDASNEKALYVYLYTKCMKDEPVIDPRTGLPEFEDELDEDGMPVFETDSKGEPIIGADGLPQVKQKPVTRKVCTVHVTKATRSAIIFEDVDTGLSMYPVAWGNWEKQKNQYHGRALVTGLLPNQIFINTMFATAMRHMQLAAFQKTVYNADLVSSWSNEVGQAIGVHGLPPGTSVAQVATVLPVAEMSNQLFALIDKAMEYTKECLGATDAQMGNVNPENTSALMVLQTNAEVPLENVRSGLYEWVEDIGLVLLDMIGTYYGTRPVVVSKEFDELVIGPDGVPVLDPYTGMMRTQKISRKVVEEFDFSQLKNLGLNLRVDVGATTYFSEIAMTQTLDNLRRDGTLDVIQYLERIPDKLIPKKRELLDELRGRIAEGTQANAAAGAAIPQPGSPMQGPADEGGVQQGGPLTEQNAVAGLPTQGEAEYDALPNIAKKTARAMGAFGAQ